MKNDLEIIQYNDDYAAQIAEMWSHSVDGWNGEVWDSTEQSVRESENNSSHLQLSLARIDDLIAGYCKLSVDHNDTGALYIDLLNVRDDYHGKKIGKKLVIDAVNKTTELKWPRVDLYTWPGNLKAVPLYKRCGFFWEKKDGQDTHLINMIPMILQTELFEDYFKETDWYEDSTRKIVVEPDGNEENKLNIWTYSWEKNGKKLEIDFTRRGRGIRRVENDDYSITAIVEDLNLVFGRKYKIRYEILNKSGKELHVELYGENDKNITYEFDKSLTVENSESFSGEFTVGSIHKNQPENQTHPSVITNIKVNGKEVQFKTGIVPKYPLTLQLINPNGSSKTIYPHSENDIYLDMENHFQDETDFIIHLPDTKEVKLNSNKLAVKLKGHEKKSLPLKCSVKENCLYAPMVNIEVTGKETFTFENQVSEVFRTGHGAYMGECLTKLEIGISTYFLLIKKDKNYSINFGDAKYADASMHIKPPKLGMPFSDEFEHREWDNFEFDKGNGFAQLDLFYTSDSFRNIAFIRHFKLFENGVLESWFTVENKGSAICESLSIADSHYMKGYKKIFPFKGKFITADYDNDSNIQAWDFEAFTENWLYSYDEKIDFGLVWSAEHQVKAIDETLNLISEFKTLLPGESRTSGLITHSCDVFDDWNSFREFALKKRLDKEVLTQSTAQIINDGNPFTESEYEMELRSFGPNKLKGRIDSESSSVEIKDQISYKISHKTDMNLSIQEIVYQKPESLRSYKKAVFKLSREEVRHVCEKNVHTVSNGVIEICGDSDFAPSVYSL